MTKRILTAAILATLALTGVSIATATHAPVAGGYGDWPLKK